MCIELLSIPDNNSLVCRGFAGLTSHCQNSMDIHCNRFNNIVIMITYDHAVVNQHAFLIQPRKVVPMCIYVLFGDLYFSNLKRKTFWFHPSFSNIKFIFLALCLIVYGPDPLSLWWECLCHDDMVNFVTDFPSIRNVGGWVIIARLPTHHAP
jgi:hypothetical protein